MKAVVVDETGAILYEADAALNCDYPHTGWSEQNPDDWFIGVERCCTQLAGKLSNRWGEIKAIGLSGQMHGAVLLGTDKKPLRPAILWNDGRSQNQCEQINQAVEDIETRAGIFAMPGFTAPKILWCAQNEKDIHAKIAHILLPKDYMRLILTGELVTDMCDGAGTLWLNEAQRDWDETLCAPSKTNSAWLPNLVEGTQVSGTLRPQIAERLGLPTGIPIAGGGGDAAAGALGIGAVEEGAAFASLGTSGQLFVASESYRPAPNTAIHCYAHCVPDRWFQMACMLNGASPIQWFSNFVNKPIPDLLKQAKTADDGPLFLPYLTGERTPHNDANIRGSFFGLAPDVDDAQGMRAVVNAIAYSFCDAKTCLEQAGTQLETIAAIGGGSQSDFVLQTMADALGLEIQRYKSSKAGPALGAARLAMVASGDYNLQEVATKPDLDRTFTPDSAMRDLHHEQLTRWRAFYQALKPFAAGRDKAKL